LAHRGACNSRGPLELICNFISPLEKILSAYYRTNIRKMVRTWPPSERSSDLGVGRIQFYKIGLAIRPTSATLLV
jgi:hypothetical protein